MRRIQYLTSAMIILCLACHKHDDAPGGTKGVFEADIDGKHWQADSAGAAFVYLGPELGGSFFQLAGRSSNGQSFHLSTKSDVPSEAQFEVVFTGFRAKLDLPNSNGITLSWTTNQEMNAARFDIERSSDGITFIKVGEVQAMGNTSAETNYSWHEKPPFGDRHYYRLKSVNTGGQFQYSAVVVTGSGLPQVYFSSASDTAYHFGFNGTLALTGNDTTAKRITGTFQFDYVDDDGKGTRHTVRNGKFTNLMY